MNEAEAIAQFIKVSDSEKCGKCVRMLIRAPDNNGRTPDKYFDAPYNKPQVELCESCFDGMIKSTQGFY